MEAKGDKALNGISRWACPWPTEISTAHTNPRSIYESDESDKALPKDSRRRLQKIGFAATSFAAGVWLLGVIWVWQIVTV